MNAEYPMQSNSGKRYRLLEQGGRTLREYESGVMLDDSNGHIVKGSEEHRISSAEDAREKSIKKWELERQRAVEAAREGLIAGVPAAKLANNVYLGWRSVVEAQVELAHDISKGHSSTKAAEFVGKAADLLPDRRISGANGAANVQLTLPAEVSALVMAVAERAQALNEPMDAEFRPVVEDSES